MNPWHFFYFGLTLALSLSGQALLKTGLRTVVSGAQPNLPHFIKHELWAALTSPQIWLGIVLCGLGFLAWVFVLSIYDLSRALPILGALALLSTFIVGRVFLHEQVNWVNLVGIMAIIAGIYLMSIPSST
jgi:multidrug transporter EmrE-like cation transporter